MSYVIAVAGKGGTGKTTIAALIVRLLKEKNSGSILAVDADPNSNLAEALGVETKQTIGTILDDISTHPESVPPGMSKDRFVDYQVQTAIQEAEGFDVLTMGKPEGPGCYCYVNNVLRNVVGKLIEDYEYVVIDNEAGLEHFSRRTTRFADALVVISDASSVGLKTAKRVGNLVKELNIKTKKNLLIINRSDNVVGKDILRKSLGDFLEDMDLDFIGNIPEDAQVKDISLNGSSLWELKDNAQSIAALRRITEKIL